MNKANKSSLLAELDLGRSHASSCLNGVGVDAWLRPRFTNLTIENMDSTEVEPVPLFD